MLKRFLILLIVAIVLIGCSSNYNRGSLRNASKKAGNKNANKRHVTGTQKRNTNDDDDGYSAIDLIFGIIDLASDTDTSKKDQRKNKQERKPTKYEPNDSSLFEEDKTFSFKFSYDTGFMQSDDFTGINGFSLMLEEKQKTKNDVVHGIIAGYAYSPLKSLNANSLNKYKPTDIQAGISSGVSMFNIGWQTKKYLSNTYNFANPYLKFGLKGTYLAWNYKNTLYANDYDEEGNYLGETSINSDGLWGFDINAGVGINLFNSSKVNNFFEINPGIILWLPETSEGFSNDLFSPFVYVKFSFGLGF